MQQSFHDLLQGECTSDRVHKAYDTRQGFDAELWHSIKSLGFAGTCIPTEFDGAGLGLIEASLLSEELGRFAAPLFLEGHLLAGLAIALGGSAEQKQKLLPGLANGELVGSVALANGGATLCGWSLNPGGDEVVTQKMVPLGHVADLFVVGCENGRLGLLDKREADVSVSSSNGVDLSREVFELSFEEAAVAPLEGLRGELLCDALCILLAADAQGAATKLMELSVEFANTREQFGQPIAQFQSVKHQLADFALAVVTARGLYSQAARAFDEDPSSAAKSGSMAKAHITENAVAIARKAVELHGGIGFTWESDVHFYFKRALFDRNYLGTPELHRERCVQLSGWAA